MINPEELTPYIQDTDTEVSEQMDDGLVPEAETQPIQWNLENRAEQEAVYWALSHYLVATTNIEIIHKNPDLRKRNLFLRKKLKELAKNIIRDPQFESLHWLGVGIVDEISDVDLENAASDPTAEAAQYFWNLRQEERQS